MTALFILFLFVPFLVGLLLGLNLLFSVHKPDSEKVSPFECGFAPIFGQTRSPFHIQFYLVAILFLVFDLEIFYLVPLSVSMYQVGSYGFSIFLIFFIVLTIGFVYELGAKILQFTDQKSSPSNSL
jgi:NADH-ubiquinone oxidoreductase chain 3